MEQEKLEKIEEQKLNIFAESFSETITDKMLEEFYPIDLGEAGA